MKISIALVAAVSAQKNWFTKEWQVTAADQAGEDIILSDPSIRSGKQWHECGAKPPVPKNGKSVECNGAYCVAVCPKGKTFNVQIPRHPYLNLTVVSPLFKHFSRLEI